MELFKLMGSVFVDNTKANDSIQKTDSLASKMGKGFATVGKTIVGATAAIGAGVAAGATAMYGMAVKSAEATDRIDKMSQKIGMSRETFQEFDFICSQSGMSVEQLQGGFKTLTAQMDAVTEGNKTATANFEKLGVDAIDPLTGKLRSQEDVFGDCLVALQNMEDGTEKARLATEIFGKSGGELMPLLNGAAGSIDEMKEKAHELGLVMSDESIDAGVAFTDCMDQLKRSFGTIVSEVGVQVMPVIQKFAQIVIDNMPKIKEVVSKAFEVISIAVQVASDSIGIVINWIQNLVKASQEDGSEINKIWTSIKAMFKEVFDNIISLVQAFIKLFQAFWEKWGDTILMYVSRLWSQIQIVFDTVFKVINDLLKIFTALFSGDWEALWEGVKDLITDIWNGITDLCSNMLDGIIELLANIVPKMLEAGKNMMIGLWDGIKSIWENISSWVSDKVSWLVDKLTFWDNGTKKMNEGNTSNSRDGSHKNGLSFVPFDGYTAQMHFGEGILDKEENAEYRQMKNEKSNPKVVVDNSETNELLRQLLKKIDSMPRAMRNEKIFI